MGKEGCWVKFQLIAPKVGELLIGPQNQGQRTAVSYLCEENILLLLLLLLLIIIISRRQIYICECTITGESENNFVILVTNWFFSIACVTLEIYKNYTRLGKVHKILGRAIDCSCQKTSKIIINEKSHLTLINKK